MARNRLVYEHPLRGTAYLRMLCRRAQSERLGLPWTRKTNDSRQRNRVLGDHGFGACVLRMSASMAWVCRALAAARRRERTSLSVRAQRGHGGRGERLRSRDGGGHRVDLPIRVAG